MGRTFSYAEAVRVLGGKHDGVLRALDNVVGAMMLGGSLVAPGITSLFDAKVELSRIARELLASLHDRSSDARRPHRTHRLEAAHTVLAVTAYFETVAGAGFPFAWADLKITRQDQEEFLAEIFADGVPLPTAQNPYERNLRELHSCYVTAADVLLRFISGLEVWDRLSGRHREETASVLKTMPEKAARRYEELFDQLATDFPEVACWASRVEHQATRSSVRQVGLALVELERTLRAWTAGRAPDELRASLARAYRAQLGRSVLDSDEVPAGFVFPTLAEAYVDPRFRVADAEQGQVPNTEPWWQDREPRSDVHTFLAGYLTSSQALHAPLLVLGHPGSGKSKLTQVLAARLPAADFLAVRVPLRDVPAEADLQQQIEHAIRLDTGESVSWPRFAEAAGDALPVILLDGFDELLQATGVSQTDYLENVARFQRREADQGRPVAVLVTSRIAVADRARAPQGTVVLRLEPFDPSQVEQWLETWNRANATVFTRRGHAPLTAQAALKWPGLAEQPLLLVMMALYDADSNALRDASAQDISHSSLYERLLNQFARRQVAKTRPGLSDYDFAEAVEQELYQLSVTAFAMFNRGAQWIDGAQLERDLTTLVGGEQRRSGMRTPLSAAEIAVGRFFFIHRASAMRNDHSVSTYEFVHATFAEYLIARLVWRALSVMADNVPKSWSPLTGGGVNDHLLHAVLSYEPLSLRTPILRFLREMAAQVPDRRRIIDLVVNLLAKRGQRRPGHSYDNYEPTPLPVPARHAAYSANLVLLAVVAAGDILVSTLFGSAVDVVQKWHAEVLLWRSQLNRSDEWTSLVKALGLQRLWRDGQRDLMLSLDDGSRVPDPIDLYWTYGYAPAAQPDAKYASYSYPTQDVRLLLRKVNFTCGLNEDVLGHTVEPFAWRLPQAVNNFVTWWPEGFPSSAHLLLRLLLARESVSRAERNELYVNCLRVGIHNVLPAGSEAQRTYLETVLGLMSADPDIDATTFANASLMLSSGPVSLEALVRCAAQIAERAEEIPIAVLIDLLIALDQRCNGCTLDATRDEHLKLWVVLGELRLHDAIKRRVLWNDSELPTRINLAEIAVRKPSLVQRARMVAWEFYPSVEVAWPTVRWQEL
ncbi:hypothetical protein B0I31_10295 [Saccharothrix carnea]|uniref:NACHT N-terminal Helical domain-containing protein n=1 Tax=Saccharothrix carnea TaxID=1280637 RepID=A0A2P8IF68_SACCR|nr:hypothetical protein [Saccharothrix carnea]PSL57118.1 hypothetical protein B0I31_10295 [Saccharothrix carnea]